MSKTRRIILLAGLFALIGIAIALLIHRSGSQTALNKFKAQLRAGGEKLTYAELMQSRSTQSNNGLMLLTNAAAKLTQTALAPGLLEPRTFVGPGIATPAWKLPLPMQAGAASGSVAMNWEGFSAQMQANAGTLEELRQILKNPPHDYGYRTSFFIGPVYSFVSMRTAAQWLMGDASNELHEGHREKALEDLIALAEMAQMNAEEYTLISQMIRVAIAGLGIATTWDALQMTGWTESELARLQAAWALPDLREGLERAFLGERAIGAEFFASEHAYRPAAISTLGGLSRASISMFASDHLIWPAYKMTVAADDELFHLQSTQNTIDALRELRSNHSYKEIATALNATMGRINRLSNSPQRHLYWFSMVSIPNTVKAVNTGIRAETDRQLLLAAIGIKRFELRHHELPKSLNQLVPEQLDAIPPDYMSGRFLVYLSATNGFKLYSVGEDAHDDGGNALSALPGRFGLWEGKDAVWPSESAEANKAAKAIP